MFTATEIRCTEEAKGGLKYDVILAEAATDPPPIRSTSPVKPVSEVEIIEKLKAAEERRQVCFTKISIKTYYQGVYQA